MPSNVIQLPSDGPPTRHEAQRAGVTVGHRLGFPSAPLGLIPSEILQAHGQPGSRVAAVYRLNLQLADGPARYYHDQAENVREAALTDRARGVHDQDPARVLPDYTARVNQLKMQEQIVDRLTNELAKQEIEHIAEREALKPFTYDKYGIGEILRDQELRALYRSLPAAEKAAAKEREPFARAILGAEPELSGLSPAEHGLMLHRELLTRFPEAVQRLAAEATTIEFARQTVTTVKAALREEAAALAVVAPPEPAKAPASRVWK